MPIQPTEIPNKSDSKSWRRLKKIQHVRLAMADVIRRVYDEELDHEVGAVCLTGLRALGKVIREEGLEQRVAELMAETEQRKDN